MAAFKLDFVNSYIDARGKMRHVFRRNGDRTVTLKGRPGSAEFMDEYDELLAQTRNVAAHVGTSLIKEGTIDAPILGI